MFVGHQVLATKLKTVASATLLLACSWPVLAEEWTPLFNGSDLTGWIAKIRGHAIGEDPYQTFRVVDGLLTVGYEQYGMFDDRFGHLFYAEPFENYALRIEYRFVGEQAAGGPSWAIKNSGVMFHAQHPQSMGVDQDFPISLEAQFLGGNGSQPRPTHNLCTPGTHVHMGGTLITQHCVVADAPTYHADEWVTVDLIVRGHERIEHLIDGVTVLTYAHPVVGGGSVNGHHPSAKRDGKALSGGYIALQSESHPIQFRQVLVRQL